MPIKQAIWSVGQNPKPLSSSELSSEKILEDMIENDISILSDNWMLIGRQEQTPFGGITDLIAIDPNGDLVLIELKRHKTPREIVAQSLDYASWVEQLSTDKVAQIYLRYSNGGSLSEAFRHRFDTELDEESLNSSHQIILVAAELDDATERIIRYLNDRDIAINVIFFQVFQQGDTQLLSRAWYIDPGETQVNVTSTSKGKRDKIPWNGEYYVSFGGDQRVWDEAVNFGFISAGGGTWYSQTLKLLSPGNRIWVNIPKTGYVGVGVVKDSVVRFEDFNVSIEDGEKPASEVLRNHEVYKQLGEEPDKAEYFVRVEWLDTVPETDALTEVGLFGNQNSVCQPTIPKWDHTIERLKTKFKNWNQNPVAETTGYERL
jgi:hypothetical protein